MASSKDFKTGVPIIDCPGVNPIALAHAVSNSALLGKNPAYLVPKTVNDAADYAANGTVTMEIGGVDVVVSSSVLVDSQGRDINRLTNFNYLGLVNNMLGSNFVNIPSQVALAFREDFTEIVSTKIEFDQGDFRDLSLAITDIERLKVKVEVFDINDEKIPLLSQVVSQYSSTGSQVPNNRRLLVERNTYDVVFVEPPLVNLVPDDAGVVYFDSSVMEYAVKILISWEQIQPITSPEGVEITLGTKDLITADFGKLVLSGYKTDQSTLMDAADVLDLKVYSKSLPVGVYQLKDTQQIAWGDTAAIESLWATIGMVGGVSLWDLSTGTYSYEGGSYDRTAIYKLDYILKSDGEESYLKTIKF